MLDENTQAKVNQTYQTTLMLWAGMLMSVFMYAAVSFLLTQNKTPKPNDSANMLRAIFIALAFSSVCAAYFVKQMILQRVLSQTSASLVVITSTFTTASVVSFGLSEVAAVYGLVLVFMTYALKEIFPFAGISLIGFLLYFPQKTQLESLIAEKWDRKSP